MRTLALHGVLLELGETILFLEDNVTLDMRSTRSWAGLEA